MLASRTNVEGTFLLALSELSTVRALDQQYFLNRLPSRLLYNWLYVPTSDQMGLCLLCGRFRSNWLHIYRIQFTSIFACSYSFFV